MKSDTHTHSLSLSHNFFFLKKKKKKSGTYYSLSHTKSEKPQTLSFSLINNQRVAVESLAYTESQIHIQTSSFPKLHSFKLKFKLSSLCDQFFAPNFSLLKLLGFSLLFALQIGGKGFGTKLAMDYEPYDSSGKHFSLLNFQFFFCVFWVIWVFCYVGVFCFLREIRVWGFFCLNFLRQCSWWGVFWVSWSERNLGF